MLWVATSQFVTIHLNTILSLKSDKIQIYQIRSTKFIALPPSKKKI